VDDYQDETYEPGRVLQDGERIEGDDFALTVLHTPGHASNHVCLLLEAGSLLFTGDHLMSGSTVVILPPDGSMRQYLDSLRRLRGLPVLDLAPGHGAVIQGATPHAGLINNQLTRALTQISIEHGVPVIDGVVAADNLEQAIERAGSKAGNKGFAAAEAAIEMVNLLKALGV